MALQIYEEVRKPRTQAVVEKGNECQWLYHLHDGEDQERRDHRLRLFAEVGEEPGVELPEGVKVGDDPLAWRRNGVGEWLLSYDCVADVEAHWRKESEADEGIEIAHL